MKKGFIGFIFGVLIFALLGAVTAYRVDLVGASLKFVFPGSDDFVVESGRYTPASSGSSNVNVGSVDYKHATWIRVGNRVTGSGTLQVTCSANGEVKLYLNLPVPSTITDQWSVSGSGGQVSGSGNVGFAYIVRGDTVNNGMWLQGTCNTATALSSVGYSFAYTVE